MTEQPQTAQRPEFSVQLTEAYVYECSVTRRQRSPEESAEPGRVSGPRAVSREDGQPSFSVLMGAAVQLPFGEDLGFVAEFDVTVLGVFSYAGDLDDDLFRVFPEREAVVILWPYLRAAAGHLGSLTALQLPILPTLDVLRALNATLRQESAPEDKKKPTRTRKRKAVPATSSAVAVKAGE